MKKIFFIIITISFMKPIWSQQIGTHFTFDEEHLQLRVKQLDEFFERFNYVIQIDDVQKKKKKLLSLCSPKLLKNNPEKSLLLINNICNSKKKEYINYNDKNWFAVALCKVKYFNKSKDIQVILKTAKNKKGYEKWVIAEVNAAFLSINKKKTDSEKHFLSPISHEINFIKLTKATKNDKQNIVDYTYNDYKPEKLSIFLWLIKNNYLEIEYVQKVKYYFLQIHDLIFTVEKIEAKKGASGWLISDIFTFGEKNKYIYFKNKLKF